ncbi:MAG TPA: ATP synthase F1 subunit delta [Bacteroidales bacterium]|nr:ATP synthase F1 subunit delta [Bacteroidales bacterium]
MNESKIAVRYSKALFLSARDKGQIKEVRSDMLFVLKLSAIDDFRDVIDSPVITNSKKRDVITALFKDRVSDLSFSMITLTVNNNRESFLTGIARCYIDLADDHEGITKVTLKVPVALDEKNRARFIDIIEEDMNTKADLEEIVDERLAGGYILKVENLYVDASLKTQLRKIRKELIKS